jgi:3-hydroxyisobutyrate dehydrogenase-like beta-hydroxyacid dehydrogenase
MVRLAWIGFGEAGAAFAGALSPDASIGYDRKTDDPRHRAAKLADFAALHVAAADRVADAVRDADVILSVVTADQALAAARAAAPHISAGALWFDMNSVAPGTKRAAEAAIEAAGGRYVDVAVMAPVLPKRAPVPLLLSGEHAEAGAVALRALGFADVTVTPGGIGAASAVKMIRSVMVKGIEALSAECVIAADAAGVRDAVIASLDASWPGADWASRFDYNLDRMMAHGRRRAAEMEEALATLRSLGMSGAMSERTAAWQRALGELELAPPTGLDAKLEAVRAQRRDIAA